MALRFYKPTTPARRHASVEDTSEMTTKKPMKRLLVSLNKHSGRNNQGKITIRHRGGGAKKIYRQIDFLQNKFDVPGRIVEIEYDPNRTARIGLVSYVDGAKQYIILPKGMKVGDQVLSSEKTIKPEIGYRMPLQFIPQGLFVYNIELQPRAGGVVARSAGNYAQLMTIEGNYAQLKMPSGEVRLFLKNCAATIGEVSNTEHKNVRYGKAGRMRHRGIKPTVRGKAMNPVDHPHGGGEGVNPIGLKYQKTPWGKHALGVLTRNPNKKSSKLIIKGRKKRIK